MTPLDPEADRQDHQREPDAEIAVDLAGQPDLDRRSRSIDVHSRTLARNAVIESVAPAPLLRGRGHVQLLLDDRRADRREADHERDDLQMFRLAQQLERFGRADPFFVLRPPRRRSARPFPPEDRARPARRSISISVPLISSMLVVPIRVGVRLQDRRPGDAAERRAAADEPEQPLGLPRVVDQIRQRPELADEQDAEEQRHQVEGDRDPGRLVWNRNQKPTGTTAMPAWVIGSAPRSGSRAISQE